MDTVCNVLIEVGLEIRYFKMNKTSIQWTPGSQVYLNIKKKNFLVKNDF